MKNAMIQYFDGKKLVVDSELMSLKEAKAKFNELTGDFIEKTDRGYNAELCLWFPCDNSGCYNESLYHYVSSDSLVVDGELYVRAYRLEC